MTQILVCESLAFVFYFLYGSFFEWAFHKHLFHSPKFVKATFKAHALIHHQVYKYEPSSYEWQEGSDRDKEHISMDWFALPMFLGFHLPFLWAIEYFTHIPSLWGGLAAITTYYAIYEYFHYCMHVPGGRWFETNPMYRFAKEHHRIHHKYMQQNLNVYFPLADLCLGTFRSAASVAAKSKANSAPAATATPSAAPAMSEPRPIKPMRRKQAVAKE